MIFCETERLILRRAARQDLEPLVLSWSDPEMTRYTNTKPDIRNFLAQMIADMQVKNPGDLEPGGPWYQFVVERRSDGALIGDLGVGFGIPGERQVELGYRILPEHQRHGYGSEALHGIIGYLVEKHDIHRFVAVAATLNTASCRLLASLGFRREGRFRQSFLCHGQWIDDDYFALLGSEWRSRTR